MIAPTCDEPLEEVLVLLLEVCEPLQVIRAFHNLGAGPGSDERLKDALGVVVLLHHPVSVVEEVRNHFRYSQFSCGGVKIISVTAKTAIIGS